MHKNRTRTLFVSVAAIVVLGILAFYWLRARAVEPGRLLSHLPTHDALVLYADFDALRQSGLLKLLDSSGVNQAADYRKFVADTKFNYATDLDRVAAAFGPAGNYMLVKGRFDWPALRAYAVSQQGRCENSLCSMPGSTPQRKISFFEMQSNLLALAVSTDDTAALRLKSTSDASPKSVPDGPLWLSIPQTTLRSAEGLPSGTRMFAHSIDRAESATLTFAPEGQRVAARLNVICATAQDATDAADQLTRATTLLRQMIEREHGTPNPADFSGVLTAGTFHAQGMRAYGYWPIERAFIQNLMVTAP